MFRCPDPESVTIRDEDFFYLRFSGQHKVWYTSNDPVHFDEIPAHASAVYASSDLKGREITSQLGLGIPKINKKIARF